MKSKSNQSAEIGRKHDQNETGEPNGSERARDEQRSSGGPRYGGEAWKVADERGNNRFGKARNDDADPLELMKSGDDPEAMGEDDSDDVGKPRVEPQGDAQARFADETGEMARSPQANEGHESGGEMAGMGRGEKPRKPKSRARK